MRELGIGPMCHDSGGARGTGGGAQSVGGAWSSGMGEAVQVYAWGRGEDGQLGLEDGSHQLRPRLIESLSDKEVTQVVCGSGHTVVLTRDGKVYTWGRGDDGRLGHKDHGWKHEPVLVSSITSKTIVQVTCGSYHTAAVSIDGELYTWGGGMYGKLGHGSEDGSSEPKRVETLKEKTVLQVACGSRHTVVLVRGQSVKAHTARLAGKSSAEVYSWGDRDNGVSGHGEMEGRQYYPRLLSALADKNVCQIAACGFHTAAVTEFGEVYTWGEGKFGRLGHDCEGNEAEPRKVQNKQLAACRVVEIACGGFHTAAVTDKGDIFTWGGGEHGQLGQGNKENYTAPTLVSALAEVHLRQVACGWSHTVVLSDDGEVWSFGNGDFGKLGHGDTEKKPWPTKIEGMTNKNIVRVASYNEHTAALALTEVHTAPNSSLIADYTKMLESGEFADVEFLVDDVRIPAHRAVLAARSEHFCAMFQSGMKESCDGVIQINEVCPVVFRALLGFLYTGTVDIGPESAFELLGLADLYRLDSLKAQCESIVLRKLCHKNAPMLLNKADMNGAEDLKMMCMRFIVRHFEVISKLPEFELLDRGLIIEILQLR